MISHNFDSIPKFETFQWWFQAVDRHKFNIYYKDTSHSSELWVCEFSNVDIQSELALNPDAEWSSDWSRYHERPEFYVSEGLLDLDIDTLSVDEVRSVYEQLLVGSCMLRAGSNLEHDPDDGWPRINHCIDWLRTTDFYICPGSTQYHDSVPGGLARHSLKVAQNALNLAWSIPFKGKVSIEGAVLVALIHDWCKIGLYVESTRNVKDEATGQWTKVPYYKYKDNRLTCFGHGASSMFLGQRFFQLTVEEALSVRWHQGRWNVCREELNELQQANEIYPLVHLLQFADQLSITRY